MDDRGPSLWSVVAPRQIVAPVCHSDLILHSWNTACPKRPSTFATSDVEASIVWYTKHLGFKLISNHAPAFADVSLGIHLVVGDLSREVERLRTAGVQFRNDVITGPGGSQILVVDPSGNFVELFEPARR